MDDLRLHGLIGAGGTKRKGDNPAVASSVSGTTLKLTPPKGCFDGVSGNNVTITDADFIAGNIKSGVNMFGVSGTLETLPNPTAGETYVTTAPTEETGKSYDMTTGVMVKEIRINKAGTYRVTYSVKINATGSLWSNVFKNGSPIGTKRSPASTAGVYTTYKQDFTFAVNDLVQINVGGDGQYGIDIKDFGVGILFGSQYATVTNS